MDSLTHHGVVYKITNTVTGKSYIGKTIDFVSRMSAHKTGHDVGTYLYNAIKKYGWEVFVIEKLFEGVCTNHELNAMEIQLIAEHNTKRPNGYNLTDGGEGAPGAFRSQESIRKVADALRGRKRPIDVVIRSALTRTGQKRTEEQKRRISEAHKGIPNTPEQKQKISNALKGRTKPSPSDETRRKQSEAHKGKKLPKEQREKMRLSQILAWAKRKLNNQEEG